MPGSKIDYEKLSDMISEKLHAKSPPCQMLTEDDIDTLKDLVTKKRLMGKGFLWLMFAVAGMLFKDLYHLVTANIHWGN